MESTDLCLSFTRKAFFEYIYNHKDEELYIIIPSKTDIEDYVLSLESIICKLFNVSIMNNKFHYILQSNMWIGIPTFLDNVIMDPKCYQYEYDRLYNKLQDIRESLNSL